jgi:hypothetical protein
LPEVLRNVFEVTAEFLELAFASAGVEQGEAGGDLLEGIFNPSDADGFVGGAYTKHGELI